MNSDLAANCTSKPFITLGLHENEFCALVALLLMALWGEQFAELQSLRLCSVQALEQLYLLSVGDGDLNSLPL